ncbi:MAG: ROK family protein [Deltaproteobacteria bacterium]|nr:ROK family protein [Deltaproteobacteria bacterium]
MTADVKKSKSCLDKREALVLAADLGGTNFRLALITPHGEIIQRQSQPTAVGEGKEVLMGQMATAMRESTAAAGIEPGHIRAVGIGIPGLVEPDTGRVVKAPNVPELDGAMLGSELGRLVPWPVVIDNDANLFALGEHYLGAGRGEKNLLGMTLGTGVGGGLVLDNKLWRGGKGTAAEIGHITIDPEGERCNCGNYGCLETLASASWTVEWVAAQLEAGAASSLQAPWRQTPQEFSAYLIHQAAVAGDPLAQRAFQRVGRALGIAIADVVHLLGLQTIILGGKFARAWDQFIGALDAELEKRLTFFRRSDISVRPAMLDDNAGLLGAARMAWDLGL